MLNFLKKNLPIGIDISDYSIEVLQLSKKREILAYNRVILEEGIVQDGKIVKKEALAEKLKELLKGITPRPSKAILSLPESKTFIHYFKLPKDLRGEELRQQIFEKASKIIPFDINGIYWDYITTSDKGSQQVVYVGTLKEIVDEYVEVIHLLNIEPIALDIESSSLGRALLGDQTTSPVRDSKSQGKTQSQYISNRASSMIIDIGARTTIASIFNNKGVLNLSITISVAGKHFTKAIVEKLKIKNDDAEKLKRTFGFDDKKTDNKILSILQASFQPIIKELKEAISYYENNRGEKIEEIILAGGSALLPKIDEYLAVNLEKKVKIGDPFERISTRGGSVFGGKDGQLMDKKYSPILFANVVGLALRAVGNISKGINLLQRTPSIKKVVWGKPRFSKLQISGLLQNIKKSRVFVISFLIVAFVILGFVIYKSFYPLPFFHKKGDGAFTPSIQKSQPGEYSKEPSASNRIKVESPETKEVSPEKELLPEAEGKAIEVKETIIIQDTPTGWLNVRKGPGTNHEKVARVKPGESYTFLKEKDRWYKIKIPARRSLSEGGNEETQGWVTSQYAIKK